MFVFRGSNSDYQLSSSSAPRPATSFLFRGVTNTSLELTWSGPVNSDYDDFDLQWTPRDRLSVINPYHNRTAVVRSLEGMFPGRLYTFSLRSVSGATGPRALLTYSTSIHIDIRTSRWQHCPSRFTHLYPLEHLKARALRPRLNCKSLRSFCRASTGPRPPLSPTELHLHLLLLGAPTGRL